MEWTNEASAIIHGFNIYWVLAGTSDYEEALWEESQE